MEQTGSHMMPGDQFIEPPEPTPEEEAAYHREQERIMRVACWLCERDERDPHEMTYTASAIPEPFGERWLHYADDARAVLAIIDANLQR